MDYKLTEKIIEQIEMLCDSGKVYMLDCDSTQRMASEMNFQQLAAYVEEYREEYWNYIETRNLYSLFRLYDTQEQKEVGCRSVSAQTIRECQTQMQDPARYEIHCVRIDPYGRELWYKLV